MLSKVPLQFTFGGSAFKITSDNNKRQADTVTMSEKDNAFFFILIRLCLIQRSGNRAVQANLRRYNCFCNALIFWWLRKGACYVTGYFEK